MAQSTTSAARPAKRASARDRIFETASDLFYRKGIRAVGVETIAAEADTTKMSLYRSFPSKDELVAEYLRHHDAMFWKDWDALATKYPDDPRGQLRAFFRSLAEYIADPHSRGCPLANAAVELTEPDHPAKKIIHAHKSKMRERLSELCTRMGATKPAQLADALFLLMEGAETSTQSLGHAGPGNAVARAAEAMIEAHLRKNK